MFYDTSTKPQLPHPLSCMKNHILIKTIAPVTALGLLLVSGANRVNEKGVAAHLGEKLKRPDADAVRALTGYAIGGIPPFGHDTPLATYIDGDLLQYDIVWAAAGTPKAVFSAAPGKLKDATNAIVIDVK